MTVPGLFGAIRPALRRQVRLTLVFVALVVLFAPMAHVFSGFWSVTGERAAQAAAARAGTAYLGTLTRLAGALSEAQSAAVRGERPDAGALRKAAAAVTGVDREHGAALGAAERWSNLRKAIERIRGAQLSGRKALDAYGELTTQTLGLVGKVGVESGLASDSEFGADTLLWLPDLIVYSGQVADVAAVPGKDHEVATEVHAALDRLTVARDAISDALRQGDGSAVTSAGGFDSLDAFTAAVGDLVGTAAPAQRGGKVSGQRLELLSSRVRAGALPLADELVRTLDSALRKREGEVAHQRWGSGSAMAFGLLLGAILLWLTLPGRGEPESAPDAVDPEPGAEDREQWTGPRHAELIDAHDLLSSEELLHVGRAVRATRGARDGAS